MKWRVTYVPLLWKILLREPPANFERELCNELHSRWQKKESMLLSCKNKQFMLKKNVLIGKKKRKINIHYYYTNMNMMQKWLKKVSSEGFFSNGNPHFHRDSKDKIPHLWTTFLIVWIVLINSLSLSQQSRRKSKP